MEQPTKLEEKINEIQLDVREISTKLDAMKGYEDRLRDVELWKAKQQGYKSGVQYLINLAIGILGILIGSKLF
jgi:hypothetical protein